MIFLISILGSFIISFIYIYYTQLRYDSLIWWHIPLSLIVGFIIMIILLIIFLIISSLTYNKKKEVKKLNGYYH